jgi:hypothetical protein
MNVTGQRYHAIAFLVNQPDPGITVMRLHSVATGFCDATLEHRHWKIQKASVI